MLCGTYSLLLTGSSLPSSPLTVVVSLPVPSNDQACECAGRRVFQRPHENLFPQSLAAAASHGRFYVAPASLARTNPEVELRAAFRTSGVSVKGVRVVCSRDRLSLARLCAFRRAAFRADQARGSGHARSYAPGGFLGF